MVCVSSALRASAFVSIATVPSVATSAPLAEPLKFFEGRTESSGTMKAMMKKPYRVSSVGQGSIAADGTLTLIQQVRDEGQPPKQRVWHIKQVAPRKYSGTMSEAVGPVTVEQIGDGYRFRLKLRSGLSAEEWLVPNADGRSGKTSLTVRKFGMTVARSHGTIRKLTQEANNSR